MSEQFIDEFEIQYKDLDRFGVWKHDRSKFDPGRINMSKIYSKRKVGTRGISVGNIIGDISLDFKVSDNEVYVTGFGEIFKITEEGKINPFYSEEEIQTFEMEPYGDKFEDEMAMKMRVGDCIQNIMKLQMKIDDYYSIEREALIENLKEGEKQENLENKVDLNDKERL